jgi:hypothetical protein
MIMKGGIDAGSKLVAKAERKGVSTLCGKGDLAGPAVPNTLLQLLHHLFSFRLAGHSCLRSGRLAARK